MHLVILNYDRSHKLLVEGHRSIQYKSVPHFRCSQRSQVILLREVGEAGKTRDVDHTTASIHAIRQLALDNISLETRRPYCLVSASDCKSSVEQMRVNGVRTRKPKWGPKRRLTGPEVGQKNPTSLRIIIIIIIKWNHSSSE